MALQNKISDGRIELLIEMDAFSRLNTSKCDKVMVCEVNFEKSEANFLCYVLTIYRMNKGKLCEFVMVHTKLFQ
jgi:hypothetical protein